LVELGERAIARSGLKAIARPGLDAIARSGLEEAIAFKSSQAT
jgi:hypothetical protein